MKKFILSNLKNSKIARIIRYLRHYLNILRTDPFNEAYKYCRGTGVEVGALSVPYRFKRGTKVIYADIMPAKEMRTILQNIPIDDLYPGKLVDPQIILKAPDFRLNDISSDSLDFIYSSHVLEHSPNIIFQIEDQIRCLKSGGILYAILPNKRNTYDCKRSVTPLKLLIQRYEDKNFAYTLDLALDVVRNTFNHPQYEGRTETYAYEILKNNDGSHHFFVYDESNLISLIDFLQNRFNLQLVYYRVDNINMNFCLKKIN